MSKTLVFNGVSYLITRDREVDNWYDNAAAAGPLGTTYYVSRIVQLEEASEELRELVVENARELGLTLPRGVIARTYRECGSRSKSPVGSTFFEPQFLWEPNRA